MGYIFRMVLRCVVVLEIVGITEGFILCACSSGFIRLVYIYIVILFVEGFIFVIKLGRREVFFEGYGND